MTSRINDSKEIAAYSDFSPFKPKVLGDISNLQAIKNVSKKALGESTSSDSEKRGSARKVLQFPPLQASSPESITSPISEAIIGSSSEAIIGSSSEAIIGSSSEAIIGSSSEAIIGSSSEAIIGSSSEASREFESTPISKSKRKRRLSPDCTPTVLIQSSTKKPRLEERSIGYKTDLTAIRLQPQLLLENFFPRQQKASACPQPTAPRKELQYTLRAFFTSDGTTPTALPVSSSFPTSRGGTASEKVSFLHHFTFLDSVDGETLYDTRLAFLKAYALTLSNKQVLPIKVADLIIELAKKDIDLRAPYYDFAKQFNKNPANFTDLTRVFIALLKSL